MYVVIFKATMPAAIPATIPAPVSTTATSTSTDTRNITEYAQTAERMRSLAMEKYGCLEFTACTEGNKEIALSYWNDEEQIKCWKQDVEHLAAQEKGRAHWYESYSVQVVKVLREYCYP